eukprot:1159141-Pelagomonas_calceolata.AAC.1
MEVGLGDGGKQGVRAGQTKHGATRQWIRPLHRCMLHGVLLANYVVQLHETMQNCAGYVARMVGHEFRHVLEDTPLLLATCWMMLGKQMEEKPNKEHHSWSTCLQRKANICCTLGPHDQQASPATVQPIFPDAMCIDTLIACWAMVVLHVQEANKGVTKSQSHALLFGFVPPRCCTFAAYQALINWSPSPDQLAWLQGSTFFASAKLPSLAGSAI